MKLVIGSMDLKMQNFLKNADLTDRVMIINKMCNIKMIKEEVDLIIPFSVLLANGLLSNTMVHFEELLISLNIKSITYGNLANEKVMEEICKSYQITPVYKDFKSFRNL